MLIVIIITRPITMANFYDENKITYPQLIMGQIKIIQNILSKELRNATKTVKNLVGEQLIEAEDTRHTFLQSVRLLGSLLYPYFNKSIKEDFQAFCELYDIELIKALDDNDFRKKVIDAFSTNDKEFDANIKDETYRQEVNTYLLNFKIVEAWSMFESLIKLFKENDFLAESAYGEGNGESDSNLDAEDDEE